MRLYSPQALAFLGDAVYELLVRERIVLKANRPVSELHLQAVEQVRASYQSQAYAVIEPLLTEEEAAALKRGRNLNSVKPPKTEMCATTAEPPAWKACLATSMCRAGWSASTSCSWPSRRRWRSSRHK